MAVKTPTKTFADLEKKYDSFYTPAFEITVGGTTLSPAKGRVSRLQVQTAIDRANRVSFSLGGVYDETSGTFAELDRSVFTAGTDLVVKVGYGSALEPVLYGQITSVQPRFPADGAPSVDVTGYDYRHAMSQAIHDVSWDKSTVPEVAEAIYGKYSDKFENKAIGPAGPGGDSPSKNETFEKLFKSSESDFKFLGRLAETFGYELFSRAGVFHLRQPPDGGEPAVKLSYGKALRSFSPAQSGGADQVGTFEIRGYDPKSGETIKGTAGRQGGGDQKRVRSEPVRSAKEAEQRAKAEAQKLDREQRSEGETIGIPEIKIGTWLELTGLGGAGGGSGGGGTGGGGTSLGFNGTYYVHEADHTVGQSGFSTTFRVSRPGKGGSKQ